MSFFKDEIYMLMGDNFASEKTKFKTGNQIIDRILWDP